MKRQAVLVTTFVLIYFSPASEINGQSITKMFIEKQEKLKQPFYQDVEVRGKSGNYFVTGEARPVTGEFYYVVEDGHRVFIKETKVKMKTTYPKWSKFEVKVNIPKRLLPDNGTVTLYFFEKGNDGADMIHVVPVVLERFY